ncbi:hypothetical protein GXB85_15040 [Cellulomonas sp. APG4]|uniref:hypothetical protein n=1 Tax=Cellulomonas sp. APG4 TaxID=1538656 RepID=UPI00137AC94D|nr:hypothetical protein [Cellulomonas sp. APG4]NCT92256.1 hypothetical protein [Cellulomonas sp. APG4]
MEPVVTWTLLAFAAALVVLVVGGLAAGGVAGVRQFLADARAGLRRDARRGGPGVLDELRTVAEDDDDATVADLFSLGATDSPAYLSTERYLSDERIGQVVGRVSRVVPHPRSGGGRSGALIPRAHPGGAVERRPVEPHASDDRAHA